MKLTRPLLDGAVSLEKTIKARRTVRHFAATPLSNEKFSQLLWAAQGITDERGYLRAAPSAGALYPMDLYAVVGKNGITGLDAGVYRYEPEHHTLAQIAEGDFRKEAARASLYQMWMAEPPLQFVITAEYKRIAFKYGERGVRYAMIEAGHIGQNIFLQAHSLGLGAGIVGAFEDEAVIRAIQIPKTHQPLLIMPVGYRG